jgi:hypothetical protein
MMKTIYFGFLLTAGLAMAACSSDDRDTEPVRKTYTLTVNATKAANEAAGRAATRALTLDGSTLNASWATTEEVFVEGNYRGTDTYFLFQGTIKPQSAGTTTILSGTISLPEGTSYTSIEDAIGNTATLGLQFPRSGDLDYGGQTGTLADIAARYDYATASIEVGIDQDRIVVPTQETVEFENQQAIVKFTLKTSDGTALLSPTALTIEYGDSNLSMSFPAETYATNGEGVIYVAIPGDASKKLTLTATVGSDCYTFTKSGVTFDNGQYYAIGLKMKKSGE